MKTVNVITSRKLSHPFCRRGFTLVELLVSMAIIIFMLSIMSQAFVIATTCMQGMKTAGELIDRIRPVITIMQRDLAADHFDGTKKLSDPDFWEYGPPREGYFSIIQGGASVQETPASGPVKYYISDSASNHALTFTSRLPGKNPTEFYTAEYPSITAHKDRMNGIFNYPISTFATNPAYMMVQNARRFDFVRDIIHCKWAELAYFIKPNANGNVVAKDPTGGYADLPLHDLYRQQRVILPDVSDMNIAGIADIPAPNPDPFNLFSHYVDSAGKVVFNRPSDVTAPWKRFGNRGAAPAALPNFKAYADPTGLKPEVGNISDMILTNVISFDVRIINDSNLDFLHLYEAGAGALSGSYTPYYNAPYADTSTSKFIFDTWTMERSQDPTKNYDLGNFSVGAWQPATGISGAYQVPFWNSITNKGIKINAIQITIRVWDDKSSQARDFVLIQKI